MKGNFIISGLLLDEEGRGIKGQLSIFGYENQGYLNTKDDGSFVLRVNNVSICDIFFKKHLVIWVAVEENKFESKMGYDFRIHPNKHINLKIYPFSKRIIEKINNYKIKIIKEEQRKPTVFGSIVEGIQFYIRSIINKLLSR